MNKPSWTVYIKDDGKPYIKYRKDFDAFCSNLPPGEYVLDGPYDDSKQLHDDKYRQAYYARNRWLARNLPGDNNSIDVDEYCMIKCGFYRNRKTINGERTEIFSHKKLNNEDYRMLLNSQDMLAIEAEIGAIPTKEEQQAEQSLFEKK